jgi:hypothetical protein
MSYFLSHQQCECHKATLQLYFRRRTSIVKCQVHKFKPERAPKTKLWLPDCLSGTKIQHTEIQSCSVFIFDTKEKVAI